MHLFHASQVDRHFLGSLPRAASSKLFARLGRCAKCRARYERHLLFEAALPDRASRGEDRLWQVILGSAAARGAEQPAAAHVMSLPRSWLLRAAIPAFAAALATALLLSVPRPELASTSAPVARGTAVEATGAPSLHLFRTVGEHETELVTRTIRRDEGILVAYSNPSSDLSYLMVFVVDAEGGVHWYYPAYERLGDNPAAAPIRTRALGVELGDEIRHALPPGPARMFALFLLRPRLVNEIERIVGETWRAHGRSLAAFEALPFIEGQQTTRLLEVTP
jgi:hypothetical protein